MAFRVHRALDPLAVFTVAATLAATVSALLAAASAASRVSSGASTFVVAMAWTAMLRSPHAVRGLNVGWVVAVPVAVLDAGLTAVLDELVKRGLAVTFGDIVVHVLLATTFGVFLWGPLLLLALFFFALPIGWARDLAREGLSRRAGGHAGLGALCLLCSLGVSMADTDRYTGLVPGEDGLGVPAPPGTRDPDFWVTRSLSATSALSGLVLMIGAAVGDARRRRFTADVAAERIDGFRVRATEGGTVLVHAAAPALEGYRAGGHEVALALLDADGETLEVLAAPSCGRP